METTNQTFTLEEFEVESFVTSLDGVQQAQIVGGTWTQGLREIVVGTMINELWVAAKNAGIAFVEWTANTAPEFDTETEPGFFDTSYPCS